MPIYMRLMDIKGDVSAEGSRIRPGLGVLKSSDGGSTWPVSREPGLPGVTVFLDQNNSSVLNPRPKIKTYICPSDTSVVTVSRISLSPGGGGVEGRDPAAKLKVEQMITSASRAPQGKLYLATDHGVYRSGFDAQGRLLVATDGGVWRSTNGQNNLRQIGIGIHNLASVEIIVADASGRIETGYRIEKATVSRHAGGVMVGLGDGSVRSIGSGVSG